MDGPRMPVTVEAIDPAGPTSAAIPAGSAFDTGLCLRDSVALLPVESMPMGSLGAREWATLPPATEKEFAFDTEAPEFRFQRDDSLEVHGSIWFYFGTKWMDDSKFWAPIEDPTVGGFDVMYEFVKEFPLGVEFGFQYSRGEDEDPQGMVREKIETYEIYLGLRKSWDIDWFATNLYVGTGVAYNWIEADLQDGSGGTSTNKAHDFGVYLHTGFFIPLGTYLVAGVDCRGLLSGKYDLGQDTVSGNYVQLAVFAGFAW